MEERYEIKVIFISVYGPWSEKVSGGTLIFARTKDRRREGW